jgi:hypothetical protein
MRWTILFSLAAIFLVTGCSRMKPEDFAGREPRLLIEDYFAGRTKAWGIFQDRFGNLRRQFEVEIDGTWDGEVLTLVEDFTYDDGETERRVWRIAKRGEHDYVGNADGVIGTAEGRAYGNAFNWRYNFALNRRLSGARARGGEGRPASAPSHRPGWGPNNRGDR